MGIVYAARQTSLGRDVALKVLPFAAVLDQKQVARFKNEAQAAAGLHHPNIVPVYAVGCERGVHYFSMQMIEGQSLDQAIEQLRGSGKPVAGESSGTTHIGFSTQKSIRSREFARSVGGVFDVRSNPGDGTTITLRLPLSGTDSDSEELELAI